jgi:predicted XRE-type DNA-binding protein
MTQQDRAVRPPKLVEGDKTVSKNKKATAISGNVFADLGFANPEEELLKAKLVREIRGIIKRRKLTQAKAAVTLGLKQPDVSALVTGRVGKFSIDRLVRCLDRLDYKVDLVVRWKPPPVVRHGQLWLNGLRNE